MLSTSHFTGGRKTTLWLAALGAAAIVAFPAQANVTTFEKAFPAKGEPASLHYQASVLSRGAEHKLEVWREADRVLKRKSDDGIETYAVKKPHETDFTLHVLDRNRRIHSVIDASNLIKLGQFTDWFDLAHGLHHPMGNYTLTASQPPAIATKPIDTCQWYQLNSANSSVSICWSQASHLPLQIVSPDKRILWQITAIDKKPIPRSIFAFNDAGYIRNDTNDDIEND